MRPDRMATSRRSMSGELPELTSGRLIGSTDPWDEKDSCRDAEVFDRNLVSMSFRLTGLASALRTGDGSDEPVTGES